MVPLGKTYAQEYVASDQRGTSGCALTPPSAVSMSFLASSAQIILAETDGCFTDAAVADGALLGDCAAGFDEPPHAARPITSDSAAAGKIARARTKPRVPDPFRRKVRGSNLARVNSGDGSRRTRRAARRPRARHRRSRSTVRTAAAPAAPAAPARGRGRAERSRGRPARPHRAARPG